MTEETALPARTLSAALKAGLDPGAQVPVHAQLRAALARSIEGGELRPGDPLPPVRRLAAALELAPNTVAKAYAALGRDGLILSRAGAGTVVAAGAWQRQLEHHGALREWQRHTRDLRAAGVSPAALRASLEQVLEADLRPAEPATGPP